MQLLDDLLSLSLSLENKQFMEEKQEQAEIKCRGFKIELEYFSKKL